MRLGPGIAESAVEFVQPLGGVTRQHLLLIELHQTGGRQAPDHVGLGLGLLGQQPGRDHAGGVPYPLDVDVGVLALEGGLQLTELLRLEGGVDGEIGRGHHRGCHGGQQRARQQGGSLFHPLLHQSWYKPDWSKQRLGNLYDAQVTAV
ncbi:hypothetical protein D3C80_1295820 [compost metagenome]